ncbi:hypothetical protein GLOIN_2v1483724 [Rhizophagus irregularis DAOM 181602=DAOM 197198]|uniref:Uncharacterized protein n=2 Tax=Rhizophagus irregularis TaxID=588596 RepID=A0A2P4PH04_RHIID|nr:hypothetical protein GLOIN_2v1483724 [Rhizophagus irregularis DAOM 181602=DAOM 197198]POG64673.1 hypothetical protein GLOIN_2v1483724 [Rhizophagus irregularis DAOM 181602=DAOM 197198]GBC32018.2 hypothetical protein GLOIN_2v1483724 [Rhizophagus irregularis DAOM 181602=DAOM 197198]|eukprot:XP_025171539.1 hypothetical protein GLOIN_2v1483724 [Rhizophagus irregularis DAOM 181602=DAOM 197198]
MLVIINRTIGNIILQRHLRMFCDIPLYDESQDLETWSDEIRALTILAKLNEKESASFMRSMLCRAIRKKEEKDSGRLQRNTTDDIEAWLLVRKRNIYKYIDQAQKNLTTLSFDSRDDLEIPRHKFASLCDFLGISEGGRINLLKHYLPNELKTIICNEDLRTVNESWDLIFAFLEKRRLEEEQKLCGILYGPQITLKTFRPGNRKMLLPLFVANGSY